MLQFLLGKAGSDIAVEKLSPAVTVSPPLPAVIINQTGSVTVTPFPPQDPQVIQVFHPIEIDPPLPIPLLQTTGSCSITPLPQPRDLSADSLRLYLSGAGSDGAAQTVFANCLGGYRSSTEAVRTAVQELPPLAGITIDIASGNLAGRNQIGSLLAFSADSLKFAAPGGTFGEEVIINNGDQVTLRDGNDSSQWIRVSRTSSADLRGIAQLVFTSQYNNQFGMEDIANAASVSGEDFYRATFATNVSNSRTHTATFFLGQLGTAVSGLSTGLASSGAGTIVAAADSFADWPHQGWCRIETNADSLREIVYYSSRTLDTLTVPSYGREVLGSTAAATQTTDNLYAVPGIRIAWEDADPVVAGDVQTIADVNTAPTSVSWKTGITNATGISSQELEPQEQGAIWMHLEIPPGIAAYAQHEISILAEYTVGGDPTVYTERMAGYFRVAVTATAQYELFVGENQIPDQSGTPDESFSSLPHTTTLELGTATTNYIVTRFRNQYNLVCEPTEHRVITIDGSGNLATDPPSAPDSIRIDALPDGKFQVRAAYYLASDLLAQQADTWLIYITFDGSTPDPSSDTPVEVSIVDLGNGAALLDYSTASQSNGTVGKVIVRTQRSGDSVESVNSDVFTATIATSTPSTPAGGIYYGRIAEEK